MAKAASTTLQDWFRRHPEIGSFSNKSLLKDLVTDKKVCVFSDERLSPGFDYDPTTGLISAPHSVKKYQLRRCLELKSLFPHAHILFVTRGFSEFIHSFYAQYVSKGGILSFQKFFDQCADIIADLLDYNYLIGIYQEAFGERVIIMPVELLRGDADRFYSIIENRLGLSAEKRPKARKLNSRRDPRLLQALPFISRTYLTLLRPFNRDCQRAMNKLYVRYVARGQMGSYLSYLIPNRILADPPIEIDLARFIGLADILATSKTYSAFKADYLMTNSSRH